TLLCEKNKIDFPPLLHLLKAEFYFIRSDFNTSEQEARKCIEKAENSKDHLSQAKGLIFLGNYYHRTGSFSVSIDNYEKCITLAGEERLKGIIPSCYLGMARVMRTIGDLRGESENYRLLAETALQENAEKYVLEAWLSNGGLYLEKMRNFNKADSLLKKCLNLSLEKKDSSYTAFSSAQIGWNFYMDKMFDSSIYYYERSLKYSIPSKRHSISSNSLGNLGTINRDLGNNNKALSYYRKAIEQAEMVNDWYNLQWIYMDMSNMYLSSGDTSNAYVNYVLFKKYSDEWIKSETAKGITEARIKYEVDSHSKEVALLSLGQAFILFIQI
ncbi:MAG TPA: tetratricopeptide repeat protein, partial [Bacteroidales bacterium]|nr:tetratricopeptide repeat protein [Bacteroidales bacterium]